MILAGVVVLIFSIFAFWRFSALMFLLTAGASIMTGFYWYDTYNTRSGLAVGILLIAYGLVCLAFALKCLFRREQSW